jgi:hypothetical protein
LELGIVPIRFEIMKRKIVFLQYILKQDKESMIYKVFKATLENPVKNDFVKTCVKYLDRLGINLTFEEIAQMTQMKFKKLVKEAGFKHLIEEKNKQKKIGHLTYDKLEMQEYLLDGNKNTQLSKIIFKARGRTLDIKCHKKWKFDDVICVGCGKKEETEEEFISCPGLAEDSNDEKKDNVSYSWFFGDSVSDMVKIAKLVRKRIKIRQKILDGPT